jgi:hypothetical protein
MVYKIMKKIPDYMKLFGLEILVVFLFIVNKLMMFIIMLMEKTITFTIVRINDWIADTGEKLDEKIMRLKTRL